MGAFCKSRAVSLEELAADVGESVLGETVCGIEAERVGSRRVVSPRDRVDEEDEVGEGVVVAVVAALERLAAFAGLGVEDAPAEGGDVVDVEAGARAVMGDAGSERPFKRGLGECGHVVPLG